LDGRLLPAILEGACDRERVLVVGASLLELGEPAADDAERVQRPDLADRAARATVELERLDEPVARFVEPPALRRHAAERPHRARLAREIPPLAVDGERVLEPLGRGVERAGLVIDVPEPLERPRLGAAIPRVAAQRERALEIPPRVRGAVADAVRDAARV